MRFVCLRYFLLLWFFRHHSRFSLYSTCVCMCARKLGADTNRHRFECNKFLQFLM